MVTRRMLISLALAALLVALAPLQCLAADQTIGVIVTGSMPYFEEIHKAFEKDMSDAKGVSIVVQNPNPDPLAWSNAARKLVALGADVIVTYGAPATLAAMKETSSVPIVYGAVYDPEAMHMTGGNATGISSKVDMEDVLKTLKKLKEYKSLGVIFSKVEKDTILQVKEIALLEGKLGFKSVLMDAKEKAFSTGGVDAMLLTTSCIGMCASGDIAGEARKARIPTAATMGGAENKGIILTYRANAVEQGKVVAYMTKTVLWGKSPKDIPSKAPTVIEIIINQKEASAIGINIPSDVLAVATGVLK